AGTERHRVDNDPDSQRESDSSHRYPRGKPRPRCAITLRWISLVPPAIVDPTAIRYHASNFPSSGARGEPSVSWPNNPIVFAAVRAIRCASSDANSLVIDASWFGITPFACMLTTR